METVLDYSSPAPPEPVSRMCMVVPDLWWGKISLDWNNNPAQGRTRLQSTQVSEDNKWVVKPCSVRVERCNLSSSSLVWGVEKVKLEDQTVQLPYHGVRVRDCDSDEGMGSLEDGTNEKKDVKQINVIHEETHLKCPKCVQVFSNQMSMNSHVLTHYYQLFFKVLPNMKPFSCPICGKDNRYRTTLVRHYALTHRKIFEITDLTPEDLPGIGKGSGAECSEPKLLQTKFVVNNNCTEEKKNLDERVMNDGLDEIIDIDDKMELSETDDGMSCPKCGKIVMGNEGYRLWFHILTHYYQVFFEVLPDRKPFDCPLCDQEGFSNRVALARHYAFSHEKILEMTDLTPETLHYSEKRLKRLEQKKREMDEKRLQGLLSHFLNESEEIAAESSKSEEGEKMEDGSTASFHSVSGIIQVSFAPSKDSVRQEEQVKKLDDTFPAEDMDEEFGDIAAPVWPKIL